MSAPWFSSLKVKIPYWLLQYAVNVIVICDVWAAILDQGHFLLTQKNTPTFFRKNDLDGKTIEIHTWNTFILSSRTEREVGGLHPFISLKNHREKEKQNSYEINIVLFRSALHFCIRDLWSRDRAGQRTKWEMKWWEETWRERHSIRRRSTGKDWGRYSYGRKGQGTPLNFF